MPSGAVVVDASVLIALARIGRLDCILDLPIEVLVTRAVWTEVSGARRGAPDAGAAALRIARRQRRLTVVADGEAARFPDLDAGEASTLAAAIDRGAAVAVDERRARAAVDRDTTVRARVPAVIGTVGLLLLGKRRHAVDAVQQALDALRAASFRMSPQLYEAALRAAGEWPPAPPRPTPGVPQPIEDAGL